MLHVRQYGYEASQSIEGLVKDSLWFITARYYIMVKVLPGKGRFVHSPTTAKSTHTEIA